MAIKKLVLNNFLDEEPFTLIAIHCTIEDYRLAFLLNTTLNLKLKRLEKDIDNNNLQAAFPIFEWQDVTQYKTWNLVSNTCKVETNLTGEGLNSLFSTNQMVTKTHHLIPEFSKANYFLKINNECFSNNEKHILENILTINQVITAYSIATENLKSKDQLIFN